MNEILMQLGCMGIMAMLSINSDSAVFESNIHWPNNGDRVTKSHYEFVEMPIDTTVWDFSHAIETGESHGYIYNRIASEKHDSYLYNRPLRIYANVFMYDNQTQNNDICIWYNIYPNS